MDVTKLARRTYDQAARAKDAGRPGPSPERQAQRAVQDAAMSQQHHEFDLSAQDMHHKYERCHFAVVGEGTRSAQEAYRRGYDGINWNE